MICTWLWPTSSTRRTSRQLIIAVTSQQDSVQIKCPNIMYTAVCSLCWLRESNGLWSHISITLSSTSICPPVPGTTTPLQTGLMSPHLFGMVCNEVSQVVFHVPCFFDCCSSMSIFVILPVTIGPDHAALVAKTIYDFKVAAGCRYCKQFTKCSSSLLV